MFLCRKLHFITNKDIERKKRRYHLLEEIVEMSVGVNARRSRALNLSEIVKRHRSSFTKFQFDHFEHRNKPLYSR